MRKVRNETFSKITRAKDEYFSNLGKKLSDPTNGIKSYWATLNKIINNKKFSNIPPLLENGVFVTNFRTKANIFNDHFVEQCSLINTDSVLPIFVSRCHSSLSNVEITGETILKIIRSLDPKKAHGWDNISINMIKLCDVVIVNPLYLIYKKNAWILAGFLSVGRKAMFFRFIKRKQTAEEKLQAYFTFTSLWENI